MGLLFSGLSAMPDRAQAADTEPPAAQLQQEAARVAAIHLTSPLRDRYGIRVDGAPITQDPGAFLQNGQLYVSLRTMVQLLLPGAQLTWNGRTASVTCPGVLTLTATPGQTWLVANDRCLPAEEGVLLRNSTVLVPLETLALALDAGCVTQPDGTVDLTTGSGGILPAARFYDETDLYWLSHIIYAESGNQPLTGKIAVGNVVLNRVADSRFPSTVKGVIFQKNQFSPAASGTIYLTPNDESVLAAKLCLEGAVALDNVYFFNRVGLRCWASRNRPLVATIAGHSFYA